MIHDVVVKELKQFKDERGKVMHMLRSDSPLFESFGEVYFSTVNHGSIKAWKKHKDMTLNLAVPVGAIKLVLFDDRESSPSCGTIQEIEISESSYSLVKIPPGIWTGFKGISTGESLLVNCASIPHDPEEAINLEHNDQSIPYSW